MIRLSANLGMLWQELALPDAVRAAAAAGFDAVEMHWPQAVPVAQMRAALDATGLPVLSLNTARGDAARGEFGLAALPGREAEARAAIAAAVDHGAAIGARNLHVLAGIAGGTEARAAYLANLAHAADLAGARGMGVLIEPLNRYDMPGYFLRTATQAAEILAELGRPGVRLMFDCYHLQIMQGDLTRLFAALLPLVGHVQFAAVPGRAEPDEGEVAYDRLLPAFAAAGYGGFFGAEYRPRTTTAAGLGWMRAFRP